MQLVLWSHQGWGTVLRQVNGELKFGTYLHWAHWVRGTLNKEQGGLPALLPLERVALTLAPPVLTLKLVNLVLLYVSLALLTYFLYAGA